MSLSKLFGITLVIAFGLPFLGHAQFWDPGRGCVVDKSGGDCIPNALLSAVPFLRITPDARGGGMGDAGIATSPDAHSMHYNSAKLAFAEQPMAFSASLSPWLRNLGLQDIYLFYMSGYYKIDDLQTIGASVRYFSLGQIDFRDENGAATGSGMPNEFEIAGAYSRKFTNNFSASLTAKYIYSNLAADQVVAGNEISSASAFAADLGFFYKREISAANQQTNLLTLGLALSNIGSKISYIKDVYSDFLPANFGLGAAYEMNFDEYNKLMFTGEINKLMVPSTIPFDDPNYDTNNNGIPDHREKGIFEGMFGSFGDAAGGFTEEMQELMYSIGLEYWYDDQFAVRTGYFHEHILKGSRQYLTFGIGLKYNIFGMDLSYLVPTNNQQSPLANTLRFTFHFDMRAFEADR
jgi:hypothetical protein